MRLICGKHRKHLARWRRKSCGIAVLALFGLAAHNALAQSPRIKISVLPESASLRIEGEAIPGRVWSFRKSYGSVVDLGSRIKNFTLSGEKEEGIAVRAVAPGEYESAQPASRFRYDVSLAPPG